LEEGEGVEGRWRDVVAEEEIMHEDKRKATKDGEAIHQNFCGSSDFLGGEHQKITGHTTGRGVKENSRSVEGE